jgi:hypothetical protein
VQVSQAEPLPHLSEGQVTQIHAICCVGDTLNTIACNHVLLRNFFVHCTFVQVSQAEPLPPLSEGQVMQLKSVELSAGKTSVSGADKHS